MGRIRLDTTQDKIRFGDIKSIDASGEGIELVGSKAFRVPTGPGSERPNSPLEGQMRFNTDLTELELYINNGWSNLTADEHTKISSNDTTSDYLGNKLVAGTNVTLTTNNDGGNETLTISASSESGLSPWIIKSSNYAASVSERIFSDTSSSSWTLTLPTGISVGNVVQTADYADTWGLNSLTVDGNGNNIEGSGTFEADLENGFVEFVWDGTEWKVSIHGGNVTSGSTSNEDLLGSQSDNLILNGLDTASAVNYLTVQNSIAGNPVDVSVGGGDTNIDLTLTPKGTGNLVLDGLSWPTSDGNATEILATDGSGNLNFRTRDKQSLIAAASDETSVLSTGTTKTTFRMPYAFELTEVRASLTTAASGSGLIIDVNQNGTSILSTKITIDDGEKTSTTASTQPVLSTTSLTDDGEITVDIDGIDSSNAATGLKVYLIGRYAG